MKKFLALTLSVAMVFGLVGIIEPAAVVHASTETIDGVEWSYETEDGEAHIIANPDTPYSGDIVIPEILGGFPVKYLDARAFLNCTGVTSVVIHENIRSVLHQCFDGCINLADVTIQNPSTLIGQYAFRGTAFEAEQFAENNHLLIIYNRVISADVNATEFVIPEGITQINDGAFKDCVMENIVVPSSVSYMGPFAFQNCTNLENVVLQEGLLTMSISIFQGCTSLTEISLPQSLKSIGAGAIPQTTTIYGYDNSAAQEYATVNGNTFVALSGIIPDFSENCEGKMEINVSMNAATINITVPLNVSCVINPNIEDGFIYGDVKVQNNSTIPVQVSVKDFSLSEGNYIMLTPDGISLIGPGLTWDNLDSSQSAQYLAIGVGAGETGWYQSTLGNYAWADNVSEKFSLGTIKASETASLALNARYGRSVKVENHLQLRVFFVAEICTEKIQGTDSENNENNQPTVMKTMKSLKTQYTVDMLPTLKLTPNYGWNTSGECVSLIGNTSGENKIVCTMEEDFVPVTSGEQYLITTNRIYWIYTNGIHVLFTDDNLNPIPCSDFTKENNLSNTLVTVPAGATRMYITYYCNQPFKVSKLVSAVQGDTIPASYSEDELLWDINSKTNSASKTFSYDDALDAPYVTFVLDDMRPDTTKLSNILHEYGFKVCIAAIPENMNNINGDKSGTWKDTLDTIVSRGGEIMAHYATPLTHTDYTFNGLIERFALTKKRLTDYGYDVRGIIMAGGSGQDTIIKEDVEKWARYFYDYSDLYGTVAPYLQGRTNLGYQMTTLEKFTQDIDSTIANNRWKIYYMHELSEIAGSNAEEKETLFRSFLAYLKEKVDAREVSVVTYAELHDKFYPDNNGTISTDYDLNDYLVRDDMGSFVKELRKAQRQNISSGLATYPTVNLTGEAQTVYLSEFGNDSNDGTTPETPKKSLSAYSGMDNVKLLLKGGETFQLRTGFVLGDNSSIGAYEDSSARPIISGLHTLSTEFSKVPGYDHVYVADLSGVSSLSDNGYVNCNIGFLTIDGEYLWKRFFTQETGYDYVMQLNTTGENAFAVDWETGKLYLYLYGLNPNTKTIQYASPTHGISLSAVNAGKTTHSGIIGIELLGFSKHGIVISDSTNVTVSDCYIHHIGGGLLSNDNPVRYGNAVEVWENADNINISFNIADWIFDTAYTNQGTASNIKQADVIFHGNIANHSFWGLETWGDSQSVDGFENIVYDGNIVLNNTDITSPDAYVQQSTSGVTYSKNGAVYTDTARDGYNMRTLSANNPLDTVDGKDTYITYRSGDYPFSQMSAINLGMSNSQTTMVITNNVIYDAHRVAFLASFASANAADDNSSVTGLTANGNLVFGQRTSDNSALYRYTKDGTVTYTQTPIGAMGITDNTDYGCETMNHTNALQAIEDSLADIVSMSTY